MDTGCFFTFSSALGSAGMEYKHRLCFGGSKRKLLSLTQCGSVALGYNEWRWRFQQERKRRFLTHELESGSGVTVYTSDNAGVTPSKSAQARGPEQLSVGVTATTEQNPTLL